MTTATKHRPFGVTLLAILAGFLAVISAYVCLAFLGLFKFPVGPFHVNYTNIWYALMWALMVWVYVWLTQMLWKVEPQGWMFLVVITIFNLCLNAVYLVGDATFNMLALSTLVNIIILIYCMLPGVRNAFGTMK